MHFLFIFALHTYSQQQVITTNTMVNTNNMIARIAAVVAGLGLVASSFVAFAPAANAQTTASLEAQIAALMAQIEALKAASGASAGSCASFTRDLTIGSTGADVTALQNLLISKGFTIAAGATGYFGGQTQAALAQYQASVGITPAAGYFGPITRAKVGTCTGGGTGTGTGTGTGSGSLSGGEADLTDFEFNDEEDEGAEGEEEVEVATIEFDVEDGDVRVERIELLASSTDSTLTERPWEYFTRVSVWVDGDEVYDMDVDDRDAWDEEDGDGSDIYRLTLTGVDAVFEEGDHAEITVAFDIADNIDTADLDQDFVFQVADEGVRAVDGEGIQHYIPSGSYDELPGTDSDDTVTFGFEEEESGDLQVSESTENPDSDTLIADEDDESDEYTVFVFEIENDDEADSLITDITLDVATGTATLNNMVDEVILEVDGEQFDGDVNLDGTVDFDDIDIEIGGEETLEFTVMVTLKANASSGNITFSIDAADVTAEGVDSGDDSTVNGSADGETHTVATTGIIAEGVSDDADANDDNTIGTFTITFEVEALEDDAYIYNGAEQAIGSTTGVVYNLYRGGVLLDATTTDSALLQSDADKAGLADAWYLVREGTTEEFTLTVTLSPDGATNTALYNLELESIRFDDDAITTVGDTVYTVPNESEFETNAVTLI